MSDLTHFWNAADNDPQLAEQLASMYIDMVEQTIDQIQHALEQNDHLATCELLHRLKGSTAILGFSDEQQHIEQLYQTAKQSEIVTLASLPKQIRTLLAPISETLRREIMQ
jgi:HPt (histidine-containing phosphotransfer) domain-containing protein